jgi:hypothetical protein
MVINSSSINVLPFSCCLRKRNGKQREVRMFASRSDILMSIFNFIYLLLFFFKFGLKDWVSWVKWVKIVSCTISKDRGEHCSV